MQARASLPPTAEPGFPVIRALEALDAWMREPSPDRLATLESATRSVMAGVEASGARLSIEAPPLPAISIGQGTLADWDPGQGHPEHPSMERHDVTTHELVANDGETRLGTLWLDAPKLPAENAARAMELALDAGWSRTRVRRSVERLAALDQATRAIAGVLDLDRVLQLIVDRVRDLAGATYAALGIFDERGIIDRFITAGLDPEARAAVGAPPRGRGLLGALLRERRSIRLADLSTDPRSVGAPPHHPAMHSFLGVPIVVSGRSVGNLYLTDKVGAVEFSNDDQVLVEQFAVHAGIAIENARLHDQVQRLAIVEERERIGRDLHDGIIQSLYAVGLSLEDLPDLMEESPGEAAARIDRAIESLNLTIRDIRNFIFGLRPELLEQADLGTALGALADEFRLNTLVDIDLDLGEVPADLPPDERTHLLQIARECLSNIARHSKATRASLSLSEIDSWLVLEVRDNGRGFDPTAVRGAGHQGLANMRGRAHALGGELAIDSELGTGTRIIVSLPPREQEAGNDRQLGPPRAPDASEAPQQP
jgi:signal transduction histidine kinase